MNWKFKVHIRRSVDKQVYAVLVAINGEDTFDGETQKRKSTLIKTINNFFPGVEIIDETKK